MRALILIKASLKRGELQGIGPKEEPCSTSAC
jgi:hypothetical protein